MSATGPDRVLAVRLLPGLLAAAPLVVLPGQVDFALLPQQVFVQTVTLALMLLWVLTGARAKGAWRPRPFDAPLAAVLLWSAVSLVPVADRSQGVRTLAQWLACGLVYVLVSRAARRTDVPRLATGAFAGAVVVAAVGLAQSLFAISFVPQAVTPASTLANRDLAGAYLVAVLPLALLVSTRRGSRVVAAAGAGLILAFVPFTQSRAAALAVAAEIVVWAAWPRRGSVARRGRPLAAALAVGSVAALALWWTVSQPAKTRSLSIRASLAESALSLGRAHPLLGVGLGRFEAAYPEGGPPIRGDGRTPLTVSSPHSEPLQALAETGVPGLAAWLWLAVSVGIVAPRLARSPSLRVRRTAGAVTLSLVGLLVDGLFGFPLRCAVPSLLGAALLGSLVALEGPTRCRTTLRTWRARLALGAAAAVLLLGAGSWAVLRLGADRALYRMRWAEAQARWDDAVVAGRAAVRLDPSPRILRALAQAELRTRGGAAVALLERVLELRPLDGTAHGRLGLARLRAGDTLGAASEFAVARALGAVARSVASGAEVPRPVTCEPGVSIDVRQDAHVDLAAHDAPLDDVLSCLADRTGLKIEYEGTPPHHPISAELHGTPLPAAVASLLEGLGIDYLISMDPTGTRVERLLLFRPSGAHLPSAAPSRSIPPEAPAGFGEPYDGGPAPQGAPAGVPLGPGQGYAQPQPGGPTPETSEPGNELFEPLPEYPEPGELTPTTFNPGGA
jgi:O-antigen ligase